MTKSELVHLVESIRNGEYETEQERSAMFRQFEKNVPDPNAVNLIYYHKPQLTPEEIVEKALAYKPIILPPPNDVNLEN